MASDLFCRTIECGLGVSVDVLRKTPIDELREDVESRIGRSIPIESVFPWAGRGNILRDRLISQEAIDADLDDAIRRL